MRTVIELIWEAINSGKPEEAQKILDTHVAYMRRLWNEEINKPPVHIGPPVSWVDEPGPPNSDDVRVLELEAKLAAERQRVTELEADRERLREMRGAAKL